MVFMHLDIFDLTAVMKKTDLGIYIAAQITKLFSHRVRRLFWFLNGEKTLMGTSCWSENWCW